MKFSDLLILISLLVIFIFIDYYLNLNILSTIFDFFNTNNEVINDVPNNESIIDINLYIKNLVF